ncbi:MAG: hypothetical protein DRQ55_14180 [Planctomycetota bacterium]|nr:MAG: hypothetical protein DRQ55_14180 [Planctomycetota bacterium]
MPDARDLHPFPALAAIPLRSERNVTLRVDRTGERAVRKRHPWLFSEGVREQSHQGRVGDLAVLFDKARQFLAIGLYDPDSPLRVRILHSGKPTKIDADFFRQRIEALAALRAELPMSGTNAYRLVNGENEGMPGFIADRYADVLVVKLYTPAWLPQLSLVLPALLAVQPAEQVVLRLSRDTQKRVADLHGLADGDLLLGSELQTPVVFEENRLRFECDPLKGQKTGFFLDQRENRARVESLAAGQDVLNVFAYSGGFSLYAARGGAKRVTSLDQSKPALEAAERNFALNRADPAVGATPHEIVVDDAFTWLEQRERQRARYDVVIIDPPSFAHRQTDVPRARAAYARLVQLGLGCLRRGGTLVMASCSARVPAADFFELVLRSARDTGRPLDVFARTEHALDHPTGFPQGAYLKCLFATA